MKAGGKRDADVMHSLIHACLRADLRALFVAPRRDSDMYVVLRVSQEVPVALSAATLAVSQTRHAVAQGCLQPV